MSIRKVWFAAIIVLPLCVGPAKSASIDVETLQIEKCRLNLAPAAAGRGPAIWEPCTYKVISVKGEILLGDEARFVRLIKEIPESKHASPFTGPFVQLDSLGGSVLAAVRMGRVIRSFQLSTFVDAYENCYSACFYIWAAGEARWADVTSRMGVHQSSIRGIPMPDGTLDGAKLLRHWGIPDSLTDAMVETPPDKIYTLSKAEIHAASRGLIAELNRD